VAISSFSFPDDPIADIMEYRKISIPRVGLSAPSYNIDPGAILHDITVSGTGRTAIDHFHESSSSSSPPPLGLLLFTNSYRSSISTGSATRATEAIALVHAGVQRR
jgi:hypothetical protein